MLKKQRNFLRLRHAKAHGDGTLKNPLFSKPVQSKWLTIATIVLTIVGVITALIGVTYIPFLCITKVDITGAATLNADDISRTAWNAVDNVPIPLVNKRSILFSPTNRVTNALQSTFALESLMVNRSGQTIAVDIREKVTTLALRTKERTTFLDLSGVYIRDATAEESHAIDVLIGSAEQKEGEVLTPLQSEMPVILDTQNDAEPKLTTASTIAIIALEKNLIAMGITPKTYSIDGLAAPWTKVDTSQYDIYFDLTRSIDDQIRMLAATLSQNTVTPSQYVDVRFGAYVYVK
jgi:hypothetical protein